MSTPRVAKNCSRVLDAGYFDFFFAAQCVMNNSFDPTPRSRTDQRQSCATSSSVSAFIMRRSQRIGGESSEHPIGSPGAIDIGACGVVYPCLFASKYNIARFRSGRNSAAGRFDESAAGRSSLPAHTSSNGRSLFGPSASDIGGLIRVAELDPF